MAIGFTEILLVGFLVIVVGGGFVARIAAFIHALIRDDVVSQQRLVWALLLAFVPLAQWVYIFMGKARTARAFRPVTAAPVAAG